PAVPRRDLGFLASILRLDHWPRDDHPRRDRPALAHGLSQGSPVSPVNGRPSGRLFRKYVVFFAVLVSGALVTSGALEIYFSYVENKEALVTPQRKKAVAAASRIEAFVKEIERQIGWTTHPQVVTGAAALEQRRVDYFRLQRQVQSITEVS